MRAARSLGGPLLGPAAARDRRGLRRAVRADRLLRTSPRPIGRGEVEGFCNQPGYTGFGNNGSVFDYFHDNSIGRCRYTNVVTHYYRARAAEELLHRPERRAWACARASSSSRR